MKDPVISAINAALDAFRANLPTDLHELRAAFEMSLAQLAPPSDMAFEEVTYDRAGAPPLRILLGRGSSKPTRGMLLYLHGGGNVVGSARGFSGLASAIAKCAGTSVALVDFRLAPESPFPAAINDAIDAYNWALSQVGNSNQLVVAGDSAGAALALSVVMNARDNGFDLPAALVLLSPWLDYTLTSSSLHERRPRTTSFPWRNSHNLLAFTCRARLPNIRWHHRCLAICPTSPLSWSKWEQLKSLWTIRLPWQKRLVLHIPQSSWKSSLMFPMCGIALRMCFHKHAMQLNDAVRSLSVLSARDFASPRPGVCT